MTYNTVQCMYAVLLDNERNANRSALYQWGRAAAEDLMLSDNCHHRRSSQSRKEPMPPESRTALDARRWRSDLGPVCTLCHWYPLFRSSSTQILVCLYIHQMSSRVDRLLCLELLIGSLEWDWSLGTQWEKINGVRSNERDKQTTTGCLLWGRSWVRNTKGELLWVNKLPQSFLGIFWQLPFASKWQGSMPAMIKKMLEAISSVLQCQPITMHGC